MRRSAPIRCRLALALPIVFFGLVAGIVRNPFDGRAHPFSLSNRGRSEHRVPLPPTSHTALFSLMSILVPFGLGALLAHSLQTRFASPGTGDTVFRLFLGIAMSITAFPVLARILEERGIQRSQLGATAVMCAAVDDVVAWVLLAVALALIGAGSGPLSLAARLIGLALYLFLMIWGSTDCRSPHSPAKEPGPLDRTTRHHGRIRLFLRCGHGCTWSSSPVRAFLAGYAFLAQRPCRSLSAGDLKCSSLPSAASFLRADRHAHASRSSEQANDVVLDGHHPLGRHVWKNRRGNNRCCFDWSILARLIGARCTPKYTGACRANCAEHRLQSRCLLADAVHHVGRDGSGNHYVYYTDPQSAWHPE